MNMENCVTVKQLIERLSSVDPNKVVVLSRDPEGNSYDTLWQIGESYSYRDGEVYPDDNEDEASESDSDAFPCVVLWP